MNMEQFHGTLVNSLRKYCVPEKRSEWDLYLGFSLSGNHTSKPAVSNVPNAPLTSITNSLLRSRRSTARQWYDLQDMKEVIMNTTSAQPK
ncbi:hypothetical protein MJO29_013741 [Puccinia striiformis f. sp. tritici]|nr:hypothetical protein MJO29_013741 [Puccinia striiformis f. sp. tritici]